MHRITRISSLALNSYSSSATARQNPISAKGIAKTVWLDVTNEK